MKRCFLWMLIALICLQTAAFCEPRGGVRIVGDGQEIDGRALEGLKIGIDPGHQRRANTEQEAVAPGSRETKPKVASGTSGVVTRVPEYEVDLQISLLLRDLLQALGAEVKMTREVNDVDISNQERAIMMNEWGADFVVRIHCNGSTDRSVHGAGVYVRNTGTGAAESEQLARCILDALCAATGARRTNVYKRDSYTGLNWSEVPCVLIEVGYMSNAEEDQKLSDPEYQKRAAYGIAQGMIAYASKE